MQLTHVYSCSPPFGGKRELFKSKYTTVSQLANMCDVDEDRILEVADELTNNLDTDRVKEIRVWLKTYGVEHHIPYVNDGEILFIDPECMGIISYFAFKDEDHDSKKIKINMNLMMQFGFHTMRKASNLELAKGINYKYRKEINYKPYFIHVIPPNDEENS